MKIHFIVLSLIFSLTAMAEGKKSFDEKTVEELKKEILSNLDQRMSLIQSSKSCVQSANTKENLKACGKQMHESMMKMKKLKKAQKK